MSRSVALIASLVVTVGCAASGEEEAATTPVNDSGTVTDSATSADTDENITRDEDAAVDPPLDSAIVDEDATVEAGVLKVQNPVDRTFADPFVLHAGSAFHLYSTKARGKHVPHVVSTKLTSWKLGEENDAMPKLPSWAAADETVWAPGVLQVSATRYVLFFASKRAGSAPLGEKGQMCVGSAVSSKPEGPFVDSSSAPLYCEPTRWSLDPSPFAAADGSMHLVWRQDVDDPTRTTTQNAIYARKLSANGDTFAAGSTNAELMRRTNGSWEDPIIENPAMALIGGKYYLFYSGNLWRTANYAIGYAECAGPRGPCTKKSPKTPWLGSVMKTGMKGPGGEELIRTLGGAVDLTAADGMVMTMHGWLGKTIEEAGSGTPGIRALWLGHFSIEGGTPTMRWP